MVIQVNGVTLFYEKEGSGPPLLLVHGNGEDGTIFIEASSILREHFTVYRIDSRGHGQSSPVSEYHYQDMADDIEAFIHALQLQDVTFYGFSDGGIIGLLLAAHPGLCRQYIISGANTYPTALKPRSFLRACFAWLRRREPLIKLMILEPHISHRELARIQDPFVILAGSNDLILESHTRQIHKAIPGSQLEILQGEGHGSYIVHSTKIADLILKYTQP